MQYKAAGNATNITDSVWIIFAKIIVYISMGVKHLNVISARQKYGIELNREEKSNLKRQTKHK